MCAALLGLMLECSTRILPSGLDRRLLVGEQEPRPRLGALDAGVDVAGAGDFELLETFERTDSADDLFGNLARRLAQLFGQFEGERHGVLAEFDLGRLFDDDLRQVERIGAAQKIAHVLGKSAFEMRYKESL